MLILLALTYRYGNAPAARVMFVTSVLAGLAGWVLSGVRRVLGLRDGWCCHVCGCRWRTRVVAGLAGWVVSGTNIDKGPQVCGVS